MTDAEPDANPDSHHGDAPPASPAPPSRPLVWAVFLGSVALVLVFPAADLAAWLFSTPQRPPLHATDPLLELVPMVGMGVLIATWVFVFWSLIGSFLNVVVHRLPLGQSVVLGGSRCPRCHSAIKWYDNLPVIGWLNLNGRCRSCDLPIASRYPVVESICAGLCTAVYFRELLSGGANLPGRPPDFQHGGVLKLFPNPPLDLIGLTLYHCGALCVLLVWGLIAWDRHRIPPRSVVTVLGLAAVLPALFASLHPLGLTGGPATTSNSVDGSSAGTTIVHEWLMQGLGVSVAGGVAGLVCGLFLQWLFGRLLRGDASGRSGQPLWRQHALGIGLALVGVVMGWQGMLGTATLLLVACLVQALVWSAVMEWPTVPAELLLVPATFLHLCNWRQLVDSLGGWWPGPNPTPACLTPLVTMVLTLAWALVAIAPAPSRPQLHDDTDPKHTGDQAA